MGENTLLLISEVRLVQVDKKATVNKTVKVTKNGDRGGKQLYVSIG